MDHLSWQWRPHISGCKLFLTLPLSWHLAPGPSFITVLDHVSYDRIWSIEDDRSLAEIFFVDDSPGDRLKWGQGNLLMMMIFLVIASSEAKGAMSAPKLGTIALQTHSDPIPCEIAFRTISAQNVKYILNTRFQHQETGKRGKMSSNPSSNHLQSIEAFKESPVPQYWTDCCFSFDLMTFFRSLCSNRRPKSEGGQSWSTSKLFSGFLIHYLLSFQIRGSYLFHSRSYTSLWTSLSSPPFHHSSETREQVEEQLVCCQVLLLWVPQLGQCDWSGTRFFCSKSTALFVDLWKSISHLTVKNTFQIYFVDFFLGGEFTTYGSDVGFIITKIIITITTFLIITSSWHQQWVAIS